VLDQYRARRVEPAFIEQAAPPAPIWWMRQAAARPSEDGNSSANHHQALRALANRHVGILRGCLRHQSHYAAASARLPHGGLVKPVVTPRPSVRTSGVVGSVVAIDGIRHCAR
jgi:hypothetical protein